MNILLTLDCHLNCTYCFAGLRRSTEVMSFSELELLAGQMDPKQEAVRLMGGEPTLHPQYDAIVKKLKDQRFRVVVFTNGLNPVLHQTAPWLPDEILLNLNPWGSYSPAQRQSIEANLAALGRRVRLGVTIQSPDFDLSDHRHLIEKFGLNPVIRLGLAQPVIGGDNHYLPDEDLAAAHQALVYWAEELAKDQIRLGMDCGFMRCHFSEADIETLIRSGAGLRFTCAPTVDVGPGLSWWRCFAFSGSPPQNWDTTLRQKDIAQAASRRQPEPTSECRDCVHHESGWCDGGCLARAILRQKQRENQTANMMIMT